MTSAAPGEQRMLLPHGTHTFYPVPLDSRLSRQGRQAQLLAAKGSAEVQQRLRPTDSSLPQQLLTVVGLLGRGRGGNTYAVRELMPSLEQPGTYRLSYGPALAMKVMSQPPGHLDSNSRERWEQDLAHALVARCEDHGRWVMRPKWLGYIGVLTAAGEFATRLVALMDCCTCNLKQYLQQFGECGECAPLRQILTQVGLGLMQLSMAGITCPDLNLASVLLSLEGVWQVGDVGCRQQLELPPGCRADGAADTSGPADMHPALTAQMCLLAEWHKVSRDADLALDAANGSLQNAASAGGPEGQLAALQESLQQAQQQQTFLSRFAGCFTIMSPLRSGMQLFGELMLAAHLAGCGGQLPRVGPSMRPCSQVELALHLVGAQYNPGSGDVALHHPVSDALLPLTDPSLRQVLATLLGQPAGNTPTWSDLLGTDYFSQALPSPGLSAVTLELLNGGFVAWEEAVKCLKAIRSAGPGPAAAAAAPPLPPAGTDEAPPFAEAPAQESGREELSGAAPDQGQSEVAPQTDNRGGQAAAQHGGAAAVSPGGARQRPAVAKFTDSATVAPAQAFNQGTRCQTRFSSMEVSQEAAPLDWEPVKSALAGIQEQLRNKGVMNEELEVKERQPHQGIYLLYYTWLDNEKVKAHETHPNFTAKHREIKTTQTLTSYQLFRLCMERVLDAKWESGPQQGQLKVLPGMRAAVLAHLGPIEKWGPSHWDA